MDLEVIALALDGALSGEYAHVTAFRQVADDFCRGADYAQHTALWVDLGQIYLLDGAQGFDRGSALQDLLECNTGKRL